MIEMKKYLQKPRTIRIKHGERHLWKLFHPYHYMTAEMEEDKSLASGASFYTFYLYEEGKETLFGCVGVIPQISTKPARRFTRLVILPEFQGMGLVGTCIDHLAQYYHSKGIKIYSATFHPKLGHYRENSPLWQASANNMKSFETSKENFDKGLGAQTGLRDGQAMFRYNYNPTTKEVPEYVLVYDVLKVLSLKTKRQRSESKEERANLTKEIDELEANLKLQQSIIDNKDYKLVTEVDAEKSKAKMNKMFKKNKRKVLTPEERKKLKEERGSIKNGS